MNDSSRNPCKPSHHVTQEKDASCSHIFFRFTGEKGTNVKSENEQCAFETGRDREAYQIVRKGLEVQPQEPLAILARGGSRSKLAR